MSNDNPFGDNNYIDDDKTILRPMPGGRRSQSQESPPSNSPPLILDLLRLARAFLKTRVSKFPTLRVIPSQARLFRYYR